MTSREILTQLFNEANRFACEEPKYTTHDLWEMCKQIDKDLEVLEKLKELINQNKEKHYYVDIQEIKEWLKQ